MRILFPVIGFHEQTAELANALSVRHEVGLIVLDGLYELTEKSKEYFNTLHSLAPHAKISVKNKWRKRDPRTIETIFQVLKWIKSWKPDLIHVQEAYDYRLFMILSFVRNIPLVLTVHDPEIHFGEEFKYQTPEKRFELALSRKIRRMADQVIVHGQAMKEALIHTKHVVPLKIEVIPLIALSSLEKLVQSTIYEEPGSILFFGRIWPYKGLEYLIAAEPLIAKRIENFRIVIAGAGENLEKYYKMMVNKDRFIVYNQYLSRVEVAKLFKKASIVAFPYKESTQSSVLTTAFVFGKPVVATKVGTFPEYIVDGETGLLVPPHDVDKFAEAIIALLKDKHLRRKMGKSAHRIAENELSPSTIARQSEQVYNRVIKTFKKK